MLPSVCRLTLRPLQHPLPRRCLSRSAPRRDCTCSGERIPRLCSDHRARSKTAASVPFGQYNLALLILPHQRMARVVAQVVEQAMATKVNRSSRARVPIPAREYFKSRLHVAYMWYPNRGSHQVRTTECYRAYLYHSIA